MHHHHLHPGFIMAKSSSNSKSSRALRLINTSRCPRSQASVPTKMMDTDVTPAGSSRDYNILHRQTLLAAERANRHQETHEDDGDRDVTPDVPSEKMAFTASGSSSSSSNYPSFKKLKLVTRLKKIVSVRKL